ncbi:MAG: CDP-glycerol glycerophosphotransferase family protein [Oscillospiraceae bacterium]|nr:CDP-glycerol glycerophosphotransferase family protein [Oscillospiraceae bacterium]
MIQTAKYPFEFSIVMSVYNMEKYIREAVDSILAQDFGFDRVQLIFVDDGSTDQSGTICDEYARRYPDNIKVIHKENGGLSSARNTGLKYAVGRYINFCDPDDSFSANTFSAVHRFFREHEQETDVACVPIIPFGVWPGQHPLHYKFANGTRVADLTKEYSMIHLQAASAFITNEAARVMDFDTEIVTAEDAREFVKILTDKQTLGIVTGCQYNYRKHPASIVSGAPSKKGFYLTYLERYSAWAMDYCREKLGHVPKFVQFMIMYDLQWKIRREHIPEGLLTDEEQEAFFQQLSYVLNHIEDDIILEQKHLFHEHKLYVLSEKYGQKPLKVRAADDTLYCFRTTALHFSRYLPVKIEFLNVRSGVLSIEGSVVAPVYETPELFLEVDGVRVSCTMFDREHPTFCLGKKVADLWGFTCSVPLGELNAQHVVAFFFRHEDWTSRVRDFRFGQFAPISNVYSHSYFVRDARKVYFSRGRLLVEGCGRRKRLQSEWRFCRELWKKNLHGGRKAVLARICYHIVKCLKRKPIWLVSDRVVKADDNGEAFFRYLMQMKKRDFKAYFVISKLCSDYKRMCRIGPVVDNLSFRHKLLHLLGDYTISAQADKITLNPFYGYHDPYRDILCNNKFIFLQHGITKDDVSSWLNRYNCNFAGFVTSCPAEYRSILNTSTYFYDDSVVWLTGMPRFDRRKSANARYITFLPTWRMYLTAATNQQTFERQYNSSFLDSEYRNTYNALINDSRLIAAAKKYGYKLRFMPHPNTMPTISAFDKHPDVEFCSISDSYNNIYATSDLVITDYSSAVFDFSYLRKPLLYFQFDFERFFGGEHIGRRGYFDYERDGFGEIEYTIDALVSRIIEYMENGCQLKDKYRERIDRFFAFNDRNNCRRVYEKIMELDKQR